jgi:hypothetical protein
VNPMDSLSDNDHPPIPWRYDSGTIRTEVNSVDVWFTRRNHGSDVDPELVEYGKTTALYVATKQYPTCLGLRGFGNPILKYKISDLEPLGFMTEGSAHLPTAEAVDGDTSEKEEEPEWEITQPRKPKRLVYLDIFKVLPYYVYNQLYGDKTCKPLVYFADMVKLTDNIPRKFFTEQYDGKRGVKFPDIARYEDKIHILRNHTFWGRELIRMTHAETSEKKAWAKCLWGRIKAFLKGRPDPLWNTRKVKCTYGEDYSLRSEKVRAHRLIELLRTVDGMFTQRFVGLPEEKWTYQKADRFFLYNISHLLRDEFYDGELALNKDELPETCYEQLKAARKQVKLSPTTIVVAGWLSYLPQIKRIYDKYPEPHKTYVYSVMQQTRGAATPPLVVSLKSKVKLLTTLTTPPDLVILPLVRECIDRIFEKIPDVAFTGLATKARINVTTASCWEKTRSEDGTISAINDILVGAEIGVEVPIRDLQTLKIIGGMKYTPENLGTFVFWSCLDECMKTPLSELFDVSVVMVDEPGKSRAVTKGRAALKVIFDVVHHICASPMRHIDSSQSGMEKSNHGWNFFQDLFQGMRKETFHIHHVERERYAGFDYVREVYDDVFAVSTDYSNATDHVDHNLARLIATSWMTKCGIPRGLRSLILRGIGSRKIVFKANGCLNTIGDVYEGDLRHVVSSRGILMGDPMTKIILHFINMIARECGPAAIRIAERPSSTFTRKRER